MSTSVLRWLFLDCDMFRLPFLESLVRSLPFIDCYFLALPARLFSTDTGRASPPVSSLFVKSEVG